MGRTWQRLMAGSIHNTIYMPVFKALKIVLPPLPEQCLIAEALNDVDALSSEIERLISKKRKLKRAVMAATPYEAGSVAWLPRQLASEAVGRNRQNTARCFSSSHR